MSRKTARNKPNPERGHSGQPSAPEAKQGPRWGLLIGAVAIVLFVALAGRLLFSGKATQPSPSADVANASALASEHSPSLGDPGAALHIVEFLDPACETCAQMYPYVKQMLADHPGRIRLSVRHVPFHQGAEFVVRLLEASRAQDRYWQTLEALLASQPQWVIHHEARIELVWKHLEGIGLDLEKLRNDMNAPEIERNMKQDQADANALKVEKTPEYFVNGRRMETFGYEQLRKLVQQELSRSYP